MNISAKQAKYMIDNGNNIEIIDVRNPAEYEAGHIPGSKLFPLPDLMDGIYDGLPEKDKTLLVYCRSGQRAGYAVKVFKKLGYENVYNFGGIMDWPYEIEK